MVEKDGKDKKLFGLISTETARKVAVTAGLAAIVFGLIAIF